MRWNGSLVKYLVSLMYTIHLKIAKLLFFHSNFSPLDLLLLSYCFSQNFKNYTGVDMERVDSLDLFLILVESL